MLLNKSNIIFFLMSLVLLIPKFDLIDFPGFHQGIRPEDILLLLALVLFITNMRKDFYIPIGRDWLNFLLIFLFFGIVCVYFNGLISLLLPLKWFQYFIFGFIFYNTCFNNYKIYILIRNFLLINLIAMIAQINGLLGGIYSHGYIEDVASRPSGFMGGSWELSLTVSILGLVLIKSNIEEKNYFKTVYLLFLCFFLIYLSGTKTGLFAFTISCLFLSKKYRITIFLILFIGSFYIFSTKNNFNFLTNEYFFESLMIRIQSWEEHLNSFNLLNYFFGIGIGGTGIAVDSLYVKAYLDGGLIFLLIIALMMIKVFSIDKPIGIILLLFSFTIDVFTSSKTMYALYIAVTFIMNKKNERRKLRNA